MPDPLRRVARRAVFYVPGFDPNPPRRYRELYRKEGAEQAALSGYDLSVSARKIDGGRFGWEARTTIEGAPTTAEFEVLGWSDIVLASMRPTITGTYLQLLKTAWIYLSTGALRRLMWLRKGPVIAALYPVAMLLGQLLLAIAGGAIAGSVAQWGLARFAGGAMAGSVGALVWWAVAVGVLVALLRWFRSRDNKLFAYYLMHDYAFSAQRRGANPPELEDRMHIFGEIIAEALQRDDLEEVLVVGHSSGAHIAVSVLADLVRRGAVRREGPELAFLSLGQVVPMLSFLPQAHRLRADLAYLSTRPEITWIDVTAPGDGCAFALCDPVSVSGVAPAAGKRWPLVLSAAFTQTLSPERWAALRWRFFRLHFQYLCAFDRPGSYDYFQITSGPRTLAARYEGRAPSKSRIDVAASGHTTMAA